MRRCRVLGAQSPRMGMAAFLQIEVDANALMRCGRSRGKCGRGTFRDPISYVLQSEHWRKARLDRDAGDGKYWARIIATNPVAVEKRREHDLRLAHGKYRADASARP